MIRVDAAQVKNMFTDLETLGADLMEQAHTDARDVTPVRSGNAKRSTKISANRKRITLDYDYADILNSGSSRQAPDGITDPTLDKMEQNVQRILRKY